MANINRDYLIVLDAKSSTISDADDLKYYITDEHSQNLFINLVVRDTQRINKYVEVHDPEKYQLELHIVKPNNDIVRPHLQANLLSVDDALYAFELPKEAVDYIGTYKCELRVTYKETDETTITTSNKFKYKVKRSIYNNLDSIQEAPQYPVVIQLFDKLSDINQYEEDRRANELARQLAEQQRQTRFDALDAGMVDGIQEMDNKVVEVEDRITTKEQAVDKLIVDTKADIDEYKVAKDQEIDEYKTAKDIEINNAITAQDNKINTAITTQNNKIEAVQNNDSVQNNKLDTLQNKATIHEERITATEVKNTEQDNRLDIIENTNIQQNSRLTAIEDKNIEQDNRLNTIEAIDVTQNTRLDAIEAKNTEQDDRLLDIEKVNKRQDMNLKCLFAESKNNMIDITEEGNSIYLQNSTIGYTLIDEIKGNTLVNCNKEPDKELILNGNINTSADNAVTITEGVDGGKVDVALEGNTLVNVSKTKDSAAITKAYTVENSGNHIALQGDVDGSCRPVVTGNTLVNLMPNINADDKYFTLKATKNWYASTYKSSIDKVKPSTKYTFIVDILEYTLTSDNTFHISVDNANHNAFIESIAVKSKGLYIFTLTTKSDLATDMLAPRQQIEKADEGHVKYRAMLLEGDYTNKPIPDYFEGLQSSFEDNLVTQEMVDSGEEVADNLGKYKVDYKVTGKNKFDGELEAGGFNAQTGLPNTATDRIKNKNLICTHGKPFVITRTIATQTMYIYRYDINGKYISDELQSLPAGVNEVLFDNDKTYYINFADKSNDLSTKINIEFGTQGTEYEPYKEHAKTLYLNSPLLEGDTIEEKDGGIYHVHRYKEVLLDGGTISAHPTIDSSICRWVIHSDTDMSMNPTNSINEVICNSYPTVTPIETWGSNYKEGVCVNNKSKEIFLYLDRYKDGTSSSKQSLIEELRQNPTVCVYKLETPQYELIEQSKLAIDSYANGDLDFNTAVLVSKVNFLHFEEELTYLYPATSYTIQFMSDKAIAVDITLGGTQLLAQSIVAGLNRISITTPDTLVNNKLVISGVGANISEVVVTNTDREFGYFEGMKSVGECEELVITSANSNNTLSNTQQLTHEPLRAVGDVKDRYVLLNGNWYIERKCGIRAYQEGDEDNCKTDLVNTVYPLEMPTYEEIDYNPLEVYSGTTRIATNSTIPTNITVKNHGFNCLLKPSTTYTISSNLGLNTVTTPSTLTEDCLRFMDTDTSDVTTMKNVLVLEGDWTSKADLIPSNFSGIESAFEQEYDAEKGKYKVNIKVANEDKTKENNITFYIDEPLRGVGDVKDRVYVKDDKVVVERNCGVRAYEDGDFETYPTDKFNTVYQLAEPTYEEVEYNDTKLFIESFKNSTLFYNSNVPVTSKLYYSYSVPIVDTVAQTANISDQQDSMIIDLATQVAVMEMILM